MREVIFTLQIVVSVLLIGSILIQNKGVGFGRVWGGGSQTSFTRRGLEKLVFKSTFALVALFIILSVVQLFI